MDEQNVKNSVQQDEENAIDLYELWHDFLFVARKMWWLFLALAAVGITVYYLIVNSGYEPEYKSEATFTVVTDVADDGNYGFNYSVSTAAQLSKTFPYILNSNYFKSALLEDMGVDELNGELQAQTIAESNMVTVSVISPSAEDSRAILESALRVYPAIARFVLGNIQFHLIDEIKTPKEPFNKPQLQSTVLVGGGAGLLAACVIVLVLALMRKTVKTSEEMEQITNLECLSALPEIKEKIRNQQGERHISVLDKRTPYVYKESMRALQIRISAAMEKNDGKILMVTSTASGEGKSVLAVNLALTLGTLGKRVVLVDCDLHRQSDAALLGCGDGFGFADAFKESGIKTAEGTVRRLKDKNIWFWGSTRTSENSTQILSDPRARESIEELARDVDYVIIDTPPCGVFQDAAVVADYCDAVLYVVKYDSVPKQEIVEALGMLNGKTVPILGYVFNVCPSASLVGGGSYGKYGYGKYGYGRYGYGKYGHGKYGYGSRYGYGGYGYGGYGYSGYGSEADGEGDGGGKSTADTPLKKD